MTTKAETQQILNDPTREGQLAGWGEGDHYMLAEDENGTVIVEPGENHRKVYVTADEDGLSRQDIAAIEGISADRINGEWLEANPEYGGSPDMALNEDMGSRLWFWISGKEAEPSSNWLLLERGHTYDGMDRLIARGAEGESPLHPQLITSYGSGSDPVVTSQVQAFGGFTSNVAVVGIDFQGGAVVLGGSENLLFDQVDIDSTNADNFNLQRVDGLTLRNTSILDSYYRESKDPDEWNSASKISAVFVKDSDNVLIENVFADHAGWEDGYDFNLDPDGPQAPNKFSHNFYIQRDVRDLTFRDNVALQGAASGAQLRPGGFIENNLFIDNNGAATVGSGGKNDAETEGFSNYSFVADNLVTLAGYKDASKYVGSVAAGIRMQGFDSSMSGNIITHLSDPTDREALESRTIVQEALYTFDPLIHNDTIVYNWRSEVQSRSPDTNLPDGVSRSELENTTIKDFLRSELGINVTSGDGVPELSDWLRENWGDDASAATINNYFREVYGFDILDDRSENTTVRFIPDDKAGGFRWDNRLNWSTEDKPQDGDIVELAGNWVRASGTTRLAGLDLGNDALLTVRQGYLSTESLTSGPSSEIEIGYAGQFWTNGYNGPALDLTIDGGRFANTGVFNSNGVVDISGGETLLATSGATFVLNNELNISGSSAKVGFDGQGGAAELRLADNATITFEADANGEISGIDEFRSGHWGTNSPNIASEVDLGNGKADLVLNGITSNSTQTLFSADTIVGGFEDIDINGSNRLALDLDYGSGEFRVTSTGRSGESTMTLTGSSEADVFYVSTGVQTLVSEYRSNDVIDLSSKLSANSNVSLKETSDGGSAVVAGNGQVLVQLEESASYANVTVTYDGNTVALGLDGSTIDVGARDFGEFPEVAPDSPAAEAPITPPPFAPPFTPPTNTPPADTPVSDPLPANTPASEFSATLNTGRTEIESLDLLGYRVERSDEASGGARVRTDDDGTAGGTFEGASGTYNVSLGYWDEDDGQSEWSMLVNGEVANSWRGDTSVGQTTRSFEVDLSRGDEIRFEGSQDRWSYARLDYVDIEAVDTAQADSPAANTTPADSDPTFAPPPFESPTFEPPSFAPPSFAPPFLGSPSVAPPSFAPPSFESPSFGSPFSNPANESTDTLDSQLTGIDMLNPSGANTPSFETGLFFGRSGATNGFNTPSFDPLDLMVGSNANSPLFGNSGSSEGALPFDVSNLIAGGSFTGGPRFGAMDRSIDLNFGSQNPLAAITGNSPWFANSGGDESALPPPVDLITGEAFTGNRRFGEVDNTEDEDPLIMSSHFVF